MNTTTDLALAAPASIAPRIGFLGVGWIGRSRMEAMLAQGHVSAAAIADPSPEMAEAALALAPQAAPAAGLEEPLKLDLDGLVIATPSALHASQAIRALEGGLAVFCQKPLGRTAGEVRAVVAAARAADRLLGVDLSYRHTEAARSLRRRIREGALGRVFAADLVFHNAYGPDKAWFYDPVLSGGGCVMDLGVHLVDLVLWLLDYPKVVRAEGALLSAGERLCDPGRKVEDYATAELELDTGVQVRLACSWRLAAGCEAEIAARIYGTEGGGAVRNVAGSFYDFAADLFQGTRTLPLCGPPDAWPGRAAQAWARRLAAGEGFDPRAERLVEVSRTLDLIYGR